MPCSMKWPQPAANGFKGYEAKRLPPQQCPVLPTQRQFSVPWRMREFCLGSSIGRSRVVRKRSAYCSKRSPITLIVGRRMNRLPGPEIDSSLRAWLSGERHVPQGYWRSTAIVIPERFGRELPDAIWPAFKLKRGRNRCRASGDWRKHQAARAVAMTLPHRSASSVTDRTLELLIRYRVVDVESLYDILVQCAPQPHHRLNATSIRSSPCGHATATS